MPPHFACVCPTHKHTHTHTHSHTHTHTHTQPYTIQELREFIAFARARITPRFTDAAAAALVNRYKQLRRQGRTAQVCMLLCP